MRILSIIIGTGIFLFTVHDVTAGSGPDTTKQFTFPTGKEATKVKMQVEGVTDYPGGGYSVFLTKTDTHSNLLLPIVIGQCEARGISQALSDEEFFRPLTYQLFQNFFNQSDIKLMEVVINKLESGTFYAHLFCQQQDSTWKLDARPSDAINLALRLESPIFTYQSVLDEAGRKMEVEMKEE